VRSFADQKDSQSQSQNQQSQSQDVATQGGSQEGQIDTSPRGGGGVSRYDPFGDLFLDNPRTGMDSPFFADRFMDRQFKNMLAPFRSILADVGMREVGQALEPMRAWLPSSDIHEEKDAYVVRAELPGVSMDKLKVEFDDGILTIRGEREAEHHEKGKRAVRRERMFGTFQRSFQLPRDVKPNEIKATYKDGVLDVRVPKKTQTTAQRIEVEPK